MSDLVERREAQPFTAEQMRMIERALTANGYPDSGAVIDDDDLFEVIQIAVSVLLPGIRAEVLTEAYWKLRVHSSQMRCTTVFQRRKAAWEANREDKEAYRKYSWLEGIARGIERGAEDIAEMLGVPEHEIEHIDGSTDQ